MESRGGKNINSTFFNRFQVIDMKTLYFHVNLLTYNPFPRQSLKRFTFRVKLSDSIFFLFGLSPIVKLI